MIASVVLDGLSAAAYVDLSLNALTSTSDILLSGSGSLQNIVLNGNPLADAPPNALLSTPATLEGLSMEDILNITISPLAFQGVPSNATVSLFNTTVYTIASYSFPDGMQSFTCGEDTPLTCSTLACQA